MVRAHSASLAAAGLAIVTACGSVEVTLNDTEGREFSAKCKNDRCELEQSSGLGAPAGKPALALTREGWLVGICNVAEGGQVAGPDDCRALQCKTDAECPPHHGKQTGDCMNGWCVDPSKELLAADAVMLCLAGTGLGHDGPDQIDKYSMALNCGSPCKIPSPCRQP